MITGESLEIQNDELLHCSICKLQYGCILGDQQRFFTEMPTVFYVLLVMHDQFLGDMSCRGFCHICTPRNTNVA